MNPAHPLNPQRVLWEDSLNWRPRYEGSGDADWIADRIADVIQLGSRLDLELMDVVQHPDRWGWGTRVEMPAKG